MLSRRLIGRFRRGIISSAMVLLALATIQGQTVRQIEILNSDIIRSDPKLGKGAQKLLGNVQFKHDDAIMTCDSAYYYSETSSLDAFSNVTVEQGDTLFLFGDNLHYEGESRIAQVRNNVKLIDDSTVLVTDYLDYDRNTEIAYYLSGGVINQGENELSSRQGYYYINTEVFYFKDSVVIINPDYTIFSDTIRYNTQTEVAYFFGPTEIVGDENYLYCEGGWYDTRQDISLLDKNAFLKSEGRTLRSDTLYYERQTGFGRARSNVELQDSAQNVTLKGNKGIYYEADQLATLTDSALMVQIEGLDTLYIHADTLRSINDTASVDGDKILLAYFDVKFYRHDIQGMCDSLAYIEKDSMFQMYGSPILWADENQINAATIELMNRNNQLHRLYLKNIALLIQQEDSVKFNQIRGKNMVGHFVDNELVKLDVTGNGQTVYYVEDQGVIIGVNRAECSNLVIELVDNQVSRVNYLVKPSGKYYPLDMLPDNMRYLDGFSWNDAWRPKNYLDVFRWK